jgi:hypothetical protein
MSCKALCSPAAHTQFDSVLDPAGLCMLAPQLLMAASGPPGHQEPATHWLQLSPNVPAGKVYAKQQGQHSKHLCACMTAESKRVTANTCEAKSAVTAANDGADQRCCCSCQAAVL